MNARTLNRPPRRISTGKLTGQKPALKMKEVWAIRSRPELLRRVRDLALFNLAIDGKLAAWLRSGPAAGRGRGRRQPSEGPRHHRAEENRTAGAIRDHRADPGRHRRPNRAPWSCWGQLFVSQPDCAFPAPVNAPVCPHRSGMNLRAVRLLLGHSKSARFAISASRSMTHWLSPNKSSSERSPERRAWPPIRAALPSLAWASIKSGKDHLVIFLFGPTSWVGDAGIGGCLNAP